MKFSPDGRTKKILLTGFLAILALSFYMGTEIGEDEGPNQLVASADHKFDVSEIDEGDRPNIVVVTMESLPYNRLPCYGYERDTTPNLCEFAEQSTMYQNVYPVDGKTPLSTVGTETGRYPFEIGVKNENHGISEEVTTMGQFFDQAGYSTYQEGLPTRMYPGLERGYSEPGSLIHQTDIMEEYISEEPVFMRYHIWGTHTPYEAFIDMDEDDAGYVDMNGTEYLQNGSIMEYVREEGDLGDPSRHPEQINNLYDDNLKAADTIFLERLLEEIRSSGEYDDTLIIITADHGQLFGEFTENYGEFDEQDMWFHGNGLHHEQNIRLPMIVKYPGQEEGEVVEDRLVSLIDILPTALESASIPYDNEVITGEALQQGEGHERVFLNTHDLYTIVNRDYKLTKCDFWNEYCGKVVDGDNTSLMNYNEDRDSLTPIKDSSVEAELVSEIESYIESREAPVVQKNQLEKEMVEERFRELGYIE